MPRAAQIDLLAVGPVADETLRVLAEDISNSLAASCEILPVRLDPAFARNASRGQHNSSEIIARMRVSVRPDTWRLLGVTELDLFIPVLTFVFGEAEIGGRCALISTHRLQQSFYGLPADPATERERALKEAVHELGHTFGLAHCDDYLCVMAPSHSVEWIDLKSANFCRECWANAQNHNSAALHSLRWGQNGGDNNRPKQT